MERRKTKMNETDFKDFEKQLKLLIWDINKSLKTIILLLQILVFAPVVIFILLVVAGVYSV